MNNYHNSIFGALQQEHYVAKIRSLNKERNARIDALKTREDAEKYVLDVRAKIAGSFGMPTRTTIPAASVTGIIDTEDMRIEKIIYESRPDFPVTAHLYIPRDLCAPAPAVLFLCGHSPAGKLEPVYQTIPRTLAANGFVVMAIDPVSQGERYQFLNIPNASAINDICTREHNMLGKQLWLCDEFFGSWRAHDALCALDYLLSRKEVDKTRVGVTGNSGGGTMTTFVQALDPRFTMAAPSCYVTSWQRNIENELPADMEQIPPGILAAGCEMGDFVLAYAPRPLLLLGQKNDFFDPRGLKETFEQCRKVYALLGAEDNLKCFIGPDSHGFTEANRRAMYNFFTSHASVPLSRTDELHLSPEENIHDLQCTPGGQCINLKGKKLVHDLITEKLDALAAGRKKLSAAEMKELLISKYKFPDTADIPYCRVLRESKEQDDCPQQFIYSRFALETDQGILTILLVKNCNGKMETFFHFPEIEEITLYVPHLSSADELQDVFCENIIAGVDTRGIGENLPRNGDFYGDLFFHTYGIDYHYNACAIMLGTSSLADRIRDLLGAMAYVRSCGVKKIRLAARGQGCIVATFAAILCDDIASLKLFDAPESFDIMARERVTLWPISLMPRGILKYTDLPDMYQLLQDSGKLEIINFADNFFRHKI